MELLIKLFSLGSASEVYIRMYDYYRSVESARRYRLPERKHRMLKLTPLKKITDCPLEYADKEFEVWLNEYIKKLISEKKHPLRRSSLISECIPPSTYKKLAPVFGLDPEEKPVEFGNRCKLGEAAEEIDEEKVNEFMHLIKQELGERSECSEDIQVNPGTYRESVTRDPQPRKKVENPFLKYIKKVNRTVSEEEARQNLGRRSGEITKMIIQDFLNWYESLGGDKKDTLIDESTLQELFQIGFDMPAAKSISIRIKEMPTVPECLAKLRGEPDHAIRAGLKKFIMQDVQMEERPARLFAFGSMLPKDKPALRFRPPRNFVRKTWLECKRVPHDLDTMKTVWGGIENLRSTIAFTNWLKKHPHIIPPAYLKEKNLLDIDYENWIQIFQGYEFGIESEEGDREIIIRRKSRKPEESTSDISVAKKTSSMFE